MPEQLFHAAPLPMPTHARAPHPQIRTLLQALVGGQPLLIVGVAEPIVIIYGFMYEFAKGQSGLGAGRFLPWAAWVCVWTAAMVALLALGNACRGVAAFTRFSGEVFGALIGVLFLQQAVKVWSVGMG